MYGSKLKKEIQDKSAMLARQQSSSSDSCNFSARILITSHEELIEVNPALLL